jgi:hypothetical protein
VDIQQHNELLAKKQRTLDWKNKLLLEKVQAMEAKDEAIMAKGRTMEWKNQVIEEKSAAMDKLKDQKGALFRINKLRSMSEKQLHAKLVKVLSLMQAHLERETRDKNIMEVSKSHLQDAVAAHSKAMSALVARVNMPDDLVEPLESATATLHTTVHTVMNFAAGQIVEDTKNAEKRLAGMTQTILDDLKAQVAQDEKDLADEARRRKEDPDYKGFEEDFNSEDHPISGAEKELHQIVLDFKQKMETMDPPTLTEDNLKSGAGVLSQYRDGSLEYEPAQQKMRDMMIGGGWKIDDSKGDDSSLQFAEFLRQAAFRSSRAEVVAKLAEWEAGKLSDAMAMLDIEKAVNAGKVGGMWLDRNK